MTVTEHVRRIAARALDGIDGLELWDVDVRGTHGSQVVEVFVAKPGGVSIDDCALVSGAISEALDADDPIPGAYRLEVASPGLERRLSTPEQFRLSIGADVRVKLAREGAAPVVGSLSAAGDDDFSVATDDGDVVIAYADVSRARTFIPGWESAGGADRPGRPPARKAPKATKDKRGRS